MPDKSRYIYLYLPSKADKERWEKMAEEAHMPLSKFVIEIVESTLAEKEEFKPRHEMTKELEALRKENKQLAETLKLKSIVLERYEEELKRYRSEAFLNEGFEGIRKYHRELIDLFKKGETHNSYSLFEALGINPKDTDLVKALSNQLEELETWGLIEAAPRGWRWKK
ncbi:MAG: hypothetical protein WB392_07950 [Methanotrichaceae archaeon]